MKTIKEQFMNDEFVFPTQQVVHILGDDGEGTLTLVTTPDGDIHFAMRGVNRYRPAIRHRMSGSLIKMDKQLEISRTLKYLMRLYEDAYDEDVIEHHHQLIHDRRKEYER